MFKKNVKVNLVSNMMNVEIVQKIQRLKNI